MICAQKSGDFPSCWIFYCCVLMLESFINKSLKTLDKNNTTLDYKSLSIPTILGIR